MKFFHFCSLLLLFNLGGVPLNAQPKTISADTDWDLQQVVLSHTPEADFIIRLGDVDNLDFGWPPGFDPFCGRTTDSHNYPWEPNAGDLPGFDRILLSSKYNPSAPQGCGGDGYSGSFDRIKCKPVAWKMPTDAIKGTPIQNIYLQIFIDDFQSPSLCSKFHLYINGKHFVEAEKVLNAIDQTGPVGKLISIPLTEDFFPLFTNTNAITLLIDEATGATDGFAIDFVRMLVNRKLENSCKGNVRGKVLEKITESPIAGAKVFTA